MVLHSGEIPEVAFHGSLYYLQKDPEGPELELNSEDILPLKKAVTQRYREIIHRDLEPENRDKGLYRGLARSAANWQRLLKFCTREGMVSEEIRVETAAAFLVFLQRELDDVQSGHRLSSINCSRKAVADFAESLALSTGDLPEGWKELCPEEE